MRIKSIEADVFGRHFDLTPESPVVVITGPNAAGKTTLLRVPELAVREGGRKPFVRVGKAPQDFSVDLTLEMNGKPATVHREVRKGTHTLSINGKPGGVDKGQAMLDITLGDAFAFDVGQLMGMTPDARLKWLQDNVLGAGTADLTKQLEPFTARLAKLGVTLPEKPTADDLRRLVADIAEARLAKDRDCKRLAGDMEREEAGAKASPLGNAEELAAKLEQLATEIEEVQRQRGKAAGAKEAVTTLQQRIQERETAIQQAEGTDPDAVREKWEHATEESAAVEETAKDEWATADAEIKRLEAELDAARQVGQVKLLAVNDATADVEHIVEEAKAEIAAAVQAKERAAHAAAELQQLRTDLDTIDTDVDVEALDATLVTLRAERTTTQETVRNIEAHADERAVYQRHKKEHAEAVALRTLANVLGSELGAGGLLGEALADTFGDLIATVDKLLEPVIGARVWMDSGEGFAWGLQRGDERIPIHTVSESEEMAALSAFAIAIRHHLGGWKFLAIDGLEVMQGERRTAFVEAMVKACEEGLLDGCWMAAVADSWEVPTDGVHHVEMAPQDPPASEVDEGAGGDDDGAEVAS